jgi:hypothetical protein
MKIEGNDLFEVRAETFRLMTGYMAPGKDTAAAAGPDDAELRNAIYMLWVEHNMHCFVSVIKAIERVMP